MKKSSTVALLALIALLLLLYFIKPHSAADYSQTDARTNKSSPSQPPTPVSPPASNGNQNQAGDKASQNEGQDVKIHSMPKVTVIGTRDWIDKVLIFCTVILVILAGIQLELLRRTVQATNIAAIAAKDSAEAARDALHLTQAADVHIEEVKLTPKGPLTLGTEINIVIKNHGQTRAELYADDLTIGIKGHTTGPTQPTVNSGVVVGSGTTLGPGAVRTLAFGTLQRALSQAQLDMVLEGKIPLNVWGFLSYRDIFKIDHVIECECTYSPQVGQFSIDRYEHRQKGDAKAN
jgi:archaellum component FlaG (FlaF/FlaG flagellin family)